MNFFLCLLYYILCLQVITGEGPCIVQVLEYMSFNINVCTLFTRMKMNTDILPFLMVVCPGGILFTLGNLPLSRVQVSWSLLNHKSVA